MESPPQNWTILPPRLQLTCRKKHHDYSLNASRMTVPNLHMNTYKSFPESIYSLFTYKLPLTGDRAHLIAEDFH